MYGYGYGYYGFDWTYVLLIIGMLLSLAASTRLKSTFSYYRKIRSASGLTGAETAERILRAAGITDVHVRAISGSLTDHYDPRTKRLALSQDVYGRTSVAAVCVAAHECGHAIQDARDYAPLRLRAALVPVANFGSQISWLLIILGIVLGGTGLINLGILMFSLAVLFQIITLPVEYNASHRAVALLDSIGILEGREVGQTRQVLNAAALTYVAAAAASLLQLLRLMLLFGNRRRND